MDLTVRVHRTTEPRGRKVLREDHAVHELHTELKELCDALMTKMERKIGSSAYIEAFSVVQGQLEQTRLEKKRKQAIEAVNDPAMYAQRKVMISLIDNLICYYQCFSNDDLFRCNSFSALYRSVLRKSGKTPNMLLRLDARRKSTRQLFLTRSLSLFTNSHGALQAMMPIPVMQVNTVN